MNEKNKKFQILLDTKNAEKWFKLYKFIPVALFLLFETLFFFFGIIDGSTEMLIGYELGFGAVFAWLIIGAFFSALIYCFAKITLSYKILHINYLKKLVKKSSEIEE